MTDTQRNKRPARRPDCVTETRIGNTILVVSGFFKEGATDTAADKMMVVMSQMDRMFSNPFPSFFPVSYTHLKRFCLCGQYSDSSAGGISSGKRVAAAY